MNKFPVAFIRQCRGLDRSGKSYRGNVTTVSSWLNFNGSTLSGFPQGTYIAAHTQYDQCGSVRKIWDANDTTLTNPSLVEYSSTYHFAYPTKKTSADPDGDGPLTPLVTSTEYDFSTALVTATIDINSQRSTFSYDDPLNRLKMIIRAAGTSIQNQTSYAYDDVSRTVTITRDLADYNDNILKVVSVYDGMSRLVETRRYEGIASYISVQQQYDAFGRVFNSSNPFRPLQGESAVWTTQQFDALGRVVSVTSPDTAVVSTVYSGNTVTVTDQAGKKRKSVMDPFGRLIQIVEAPGTLNFVTEYQYDVVGNLVKVTQGTQLRHFMYDSLKRLIRSRSPEQGINASLSLSDPLTLNAAWSAGYRYDKNGNLAQRTDPRGVIASYSYDALNRNVGISYSNDPTNTPSVTHVFDGAINGKGRLYRSETTGLSLITVDSYDALGRPLVQRQQFYVSNSWGQAYTVRRSYNLAGGIINQTYPSNHVATYMYDSAGRLESFSGTLGDGTTRLYSNEIIYSPFGGLAKEKFGSDIPVYNKLFYNSRGQLAEIRESTSYTGPSDYDSNRGAIINNYSNQCAGICSGSSMPDNNGNLKQQDIQIPGAPTRSQFYEYDSLNRLLSVREVLSGTDQWRQWFSYDRWGNRTIDTTVNLPQDNMPRTYGLGINNKAFNVSAATNRLGVPAGETGTMQYDFAGNLTNDTYTGSGNRTYDAENRLVAASGGNNQAQNYGYDAAGHRIKRTANSVETWQVYGYDNELIAEYAAGAAATSPQKEYGYRNGQLLVTAEPEAFTPVNVALGTNGATASASSSATGFSASGAINGDRRGLFVGQNGYWSSPSPSSPAWLEVQFNTSKTITEIDVVTVQDNYRAPVEPTETMTFSSYGLAGYTVQYWSGSAWVTIPGGGVSGNNKVWRKFTFTAITTAKIRVLSSASPDGFSRLTELEAWTGPSPTPRYNLALGAIATASSSATTGYGPSGVVNGDRKSLNWGSGGGWADAAPANSFPDWLQVDFGSNRTIAEIDVFTLQDDYAGSTEPTESMTFTQWGVTGYEVQFWSGSNWITVPGGSVTGSNKIWRKFTFSPIITSKVRVLTNAAADGYSRLTEIEVYAPTQSNGSSRSVQWFVSDHLGTPRIVIDQTGDVNKIKRHDYLPFGEELVAPIGGRNTEQGYAGADGLRQQFTAKERDLETGLDYFGARYYSGVQGRFISPDPIFASSRPASPQSWNRYSYCINTPMVLRDLTGLDWGVTEWTDSRGYHRNYHWFEGKVGTHNGRRYQPVNFGSAGFLDVPTVDGQIVRIKNSGIVRQVVYSGPSGGGGGSSSASTLNMTAGFIDGAVPFGKEAREAVFGKMGVDTDSPEYENASLISTGVVIAAQLLTGSGEAQLGVKLASRAGAESAEMTMVRVIERGEKLETIINEAKVLTFQTGNEHALVKLATGERALVAGGPGGINFAEGSITRIFGHTHPYGTAIVGPSNADRAAIQAVGQRSSWLLEGGTLGKFTAH